MVNLMTENEVSKRLNVSVRRSSRLDLWSVTSRRSLRLGLRRCRLAGVPGMSDLSGQAGREVESSK